MTFCDTEPGGFNIQMDIHYVFGTYMYSVHTALVKKCTRYKGTMYIKAVNFALCVHIFSYCDDGQISQTLHAHEVRLWGWQDNIIINCVLISQNLVYTRGVARIFGEGGPGGGVPKKICQRS